MSVPTRNQWGVLNGLALVLGIASIWQGCNVFAGLDDVKFETGGSAGTAGSGGTSTSTTTTGTGAGGMTTSTTTTGGAAGTGAGGTFTTSSSTGGVAGSTTSTTTTGGTGGVGVSSSSMSSSSTGGTGGAPVNDMYCGGALTCAVGPQICCWDKLGTNMPANTGKCVDIPFMAADCDNSDTPTGLQTTIYCQSADDCAAGESCCATLDPTPSYHYITVECKATCNGGNERTLCTGPADVTTCPVGETCNPSMSLPPGFYTCF